MSSVIFDGEQDLIGDVRRDGFFVAKDFFDRETVLAARAELAELLDRDVAERERLSAKRAKVPALRKDEDPATGQGYTTAITPQMHTRHFPAWESPTFAKLVGDMFAHPEMEAFRRAVIGEHIRLRIDLIRRASGIDDVVDDFQIPHAWHRDTPGEFTFGIFFDDLDSPDSGGTAVIPGTHMEARHPMWDIALSESAMPFKDHYLAGLRRVPEDFWNNAPKNRAGRAALKGKPRELRGRAGDIYFFLNDTWHGRWGNASGKRHMIARIGGFASEYAFKDDIPLPESGQCLDPRLAALYATDPPTNSSDATLLREMEGRGSSDVFEAAATEKAALLKDIDVTAEIEAEKAARRKAAGMVKRVRNRLARIGT